MGVYERKDRFYKRAKDEGFASRAVYKLQELDRRFRLFNKGACVLDLGAAPGSWMEWIAERVGESGLVVGVDLLPLHISLKTPMQFIQGDFTAPDSRERIREAASGKPFDVIVSDAAPNLSGIGFADQERSLKLNLAAIRIAEALLKPSGILLIKSFEGEIETPLKHHLQAGFIDIKRITPEATRKTSRELYWIAQKNEFNS